MNRRRLCVLLILLFVLAAGTRTVPAQQKDVSSLQDQLSRIDREIQALQSQLLNANQKFKVENASLVKMDKQISLIHQKINLYNAEIKRKQKIIDRLESQIDSLQKKSEILKSIFRKQVVFAYKYRRGKHLDWILGASNFNTALIRYRYFQKAALAEREVYQHLQRVNRQLKEKRLTLNRELAETRRLLADSRKEETRLKSRRKMKANLVAQITRNKQLLSRALREKQKSRQKLMQLIASLEKGRSTREYQAKTQIKWERLTGDFKRNKGKLNWPVRGTLFHRFGRYKNPQLKTVLNNTGIDIKARTGSEVHCVFPGVVSLITYLSGFGNTVIIDHNDGYYTVYSHLDQVLVNRDEFVAGGKVIGTVGESGSLEGPKLHFELYGNDKPLNPLSWLKRR